MEPQSINLLNSWLTWAGLFVASFFGLFYAFQKHVFVPFPVLGAWLGRIFFYPTLPLTLINRTLLHPEPLLSKVDDTLYLAGVILPWNVAALQAHSVYAIICVMDEYSGPRSMYLSSGVHEYLRLPVVDHCEPTVADLRTAVRLIERCANAGQKVLVHCRAGHGRSAAVAMAWLLYKYGMSPEEAQNQLLAARKVRKSLPKQANILEFAALVRTKQVV